MPRSVAVVGGGISGLVAARTLAAKGSRVTVFEAGPRPGGQVHTVTFAGHPVDVGAEALHLAGPHVQALIDDLGLGEDLVRSNAGSAWIWTARGLRRLPAGVGPAGPTRLGPVVGSRVLSLRGLARAALEPLVPKHDPGRDLGVGTFLSRRFGAQVTERLVDPVLGSLHSGDVSKLSLHAATPHLAAQVSSHRSLLLAQRHRRGAGAPSFATFRSGLAALTTALVRSPGVEVRVDREVDCLVPAAGGYEVRTVAGTERFEAVVLAVPAARASALVRPWSAPASSALSCLRTASVATVAVSYPRAAVEAVPAMAATGLLVPSSSGRLLKASTFLSSKWAHLDDPDRFLVRMSAGRAGSEVVAGMDDGELAQRLHADLAAATGLAAEPTDVHVERWPDSLAQLEVGHLDRMAEIRRALGGHRGLVLAGAPYEGIGLASCIRAGAAAADHLSDDLGPREAVVA